MGDRQGKLLLCGACILLCMCYKVTSLEQLSLAEFSWTMQAENGRKNVQGISIDLVLMVKCSTIQIFKVICLCQKSAESL